MDGFTAMRVLIKCRLLTRRVLKDQLLTEIQFVVILVVICEFDPKSTVIVFDVPIDPGTATVAVFGGSGQTGASACRQSAVIPDVVEPALQKRRMREVVAKLSQGLDKGFWSTIRRCQH